MEDSRKKTKEYILAVDTSSINLSMGLWKNSEYLGGKNLSGSKGCSHLFAAELDKLLKSYRVSVENLTAAAFGLGPGSYTGLRIGLASLKGLMVALPIKAVGLSSLDIIASNVKKPLFAVAVDARREKIYVNFYRRKKDGLSHIYEKPLLLSMDEFQEEVFRVASSEKIWIAGDAIVRYEESLEKLKNCELLKSSFWYPKVKNAFALIHHQMAEKKWLSLSDVRPVYMRRSEAEEKWGICYDERDIEN